MVWKSSKASSKAVLAKAVWLAVQVEELKKARALLVSSASTKIDSRVSFSMVKGGQLSLDVKVMYVLGKHAQ